MKSGRLIRDCLALCLIWRHLDFLQAITVALSNPLDRASPADVQGPAKQSRRLFRAIATINFWMLNFPEGLLF
jgi:hypothetical protein